MMICSRPSQLPTNPKQASVAILLRFTIAATVLGLLAVSYEAPFVERMLPLFRVWFELFDDTYRTTELSVSRAQGNGETIIHRVTAMRSPHVVGGRVLFAEPGVRLANDAGAGLPMQTLVIGLALAIAWPARRGWPESLLRCAIVFPLLMLVVLFDVPAIPYGVQWMNEEKLFHVEEFSPVVVWSDVMNSGGRFVLTALAVVIAVFSAGLAFTGRSKMATVSFRGR